MCHGCLERSLILDCREGSAARTCTRCDKFVLIRRAHYYSFLHQMLIIFKFSLAHLAAIHVSIYVIIIGQKKHTWFKNCTSHLFDQHYITMVRLPLQIFSHFRSTSYYLTSNWENVGAHLTAHLFCACVCVWPKYAWGVKFKKKKKKCCPVATPAGFCPSKSNSLCQWGRPAVQTTCQTALMETNAIDQHRH